MNQGGAGTARIGVVSASNLNTIEGERVIDNLKRIYGAQAIGIPVSKSSANDPIVVSYSLQIKF